jgi:hypothetical protein
MIRSTPGDLAAALRATAGTDRDARLSPDVCATEAFEGRAAFGETPAYSLPGANSCRKEKVGVPPSRPSSRQTSATERGRHLMTIRPPPKFDPAALISSIQMRGMPVAEIARETGLNRAHVYRLLKGDARSPSYDTATRLMALRDQVVTKGVQPGSRNPSGDCRLSEFRATSPCRDRARRGRPNTARAATRAVAH